MSYKILFTLILFIVTQLYGEEYINTSPCATPATANDDLNHKFRYGCFCGEEYPNIIHPSQLSYRELNTTQRHELIAQYRAITPYDDIDKVCQLHDICYIQKGKKAKSCNQALYQSLNEIEEQFKAATEENLSSEQCQHLAFDIGSVFNTIFAPSDEDDTIFDFGMLLVNGGITAGNKVLQESADTLSDGNNPRYPPAGVKCLVKRLRQKKPKPQSTPQQKIQIRTIQRH